MTITGETPISERELTMGEEMSYITFGELVQELTGVPFGEIYRDSVKGEDGEEGYME